ncbi:MAG: hypothetical protein ACRCYU_05745 [Nocardioides sp.]
MTESGRRPLPEGVRLVHIGPHKTGSSAIQVSLHRARQELAQHGVHYAGVGTRPKRAAWALGIRGKPATAAPLNIRYWQALVDEVADAPGTRVCVSNEDFGRATLAQIERVVKDLGGDRVHVVAVARRLDRYLPSQWQERVKAGDTRSYDEWLRVVLDRDNKNFDWDRRNVWHSHGTGQLINRWNRVLGPGRFTLIVGDETDRTQQVRTFEQLLGLPANLLRVHADRANRGLSWWETEFVRRVNLATREYGWDSPKQRRMVWREVVSVLTSLPAPQVGLPSPPLPGWAVDRVRDFSARRVGALRSMDLDVVGDLDWLLVPDEVAVGYPPIESLTGMVSAASTVAAMLARNAEAARNTLDPPGALRSPSEHGRNGRRESDGLIGTWLTLIRSLGRRVRARGRS